MLEPFGRKPNGDKREGEDEQRDGDRGDTEPSREMSELDLKGVGGCRSRTRSAITPSAVAGPVATTIPRPAPERRSSPRTSPWGGRPAPRAHRRQRGRPLQLGAILP